MEAVPPCSVGLAGDGDEIAALEQVEEVFGVALDDRDAAQWHTAGDVFASLLKALPPDAATSPETWPKFAEALTNETGIDPGLVTRDSPLLLAPKGFWGELKDAAVIVVMFWAVVLLAALLF
ncbi:MAG: hypothetical protein ACJ8ER_03045 [Allosphingosinicella sp.]